MPLEREMLPDRPEARKEFLRTFWVSKTTHAPKEVPLGDATLTFTRWLVAVLSQVVHPGCRLDERMLHARKFRNFRLYR